MEVLQPGKFLPPGVYPVPCVHGPAAETTRIDPFPSETIDVASAKTPHSVRLATPNCWHGCAEGAEGARTVEPEGGAAVLAVGEEGLAEAAHPAMAVHRVGELGVNAAALRGCRRVGSEPVGRPFERRAVLDPCRKMVAVVVRVAIRRRSAAQM